MTKEKNQTREVLFTFNKTEFYKDSIYKVKNKVDLNAPKAYKDLGATKLPSRGIGEGIPIPFNEQSNIYDVGFSDSSPCYKDLDKRQSTDEARTRTTNILKPYLKAVGSDAEASKIHSNFDFWEHKSRMFTIDHNTIINTADPVQAFVLYLAVISLRVAIEDDQKNPKYRNTPYVISDSDGKRESRNEKVLNKAKANKKFLNALDDNKNLLISILRYMNMKVNDNTSEDALYILAENNLLPVPEKVEEFLSLYKRSEDKTFQEELAIYKNLSGNSKVQITKNARGYYIFKNKEVGADLKSASKNIAIDPELDEIKETILLG